jgi:hypothetical protein
MEATNTSKLKHAIALTVRRKPHATDDGIANLIMESESELIHSWVRERLMQLIRHQTRVKEPLPEAGPYQMFLDGFTSLAEMLPLPGRGKRLSTATIVGCAPA